MSKCDDVDDKELLKEALEIAIQALEDLQYREVEHTTWCLDSSKGHCICGVELPADTLSSIYSILNR